MAYRSKKYELSASKILCFTSCRRKYFLRYVEQLVPLRTSQIMNEGSLFHFGAALLFDLKRQAGGHEPEFGIVLNAVKSKAYEYGLDEYSATSVIESLLKLTQSEIYQKLEITHTEKHVKTKINNTSLHGYFDAIGTVNFGTKVPVIVELKRRKQLTEKVIQHTAYQYQPALYSIIARELGIENAGVLYINMKACSLKPKLTTPTEDRKYKKDGEPYSWVQLEDESPRDFGFRVREWYDSEDAVVYHLDTRTESQMDESVRDIMDIKRDMINAANRSAFYKNPNCCAIMGCEFESVCLEDTPELRAGCFGCKQQQAAQVIQEGQF